MDQVAAAVAAVAVDQVDLAVAVDQVGPLDIMAVAALAV